MDSDIEKTWKIQYIQSSKIQYTGVSKNRGTPKSSILIGFSIINHPFWGSPIFGNTHTDMLHVHVQQEGRCG